MFISDALDCEHLLAHPDLASEAGFTSEMLTAFRDWLLAANTKADPWFGF